MATIAEMKVEMKKEEEVEDSIGDREGGSYCPLYNPIHLFVFVTHRRVVIDVVLFCSAHNPTAIQ